jgi:hypothetical protein
MQASSCCRLALLLLLPPMLLLLLLLLLLFSPRYPDCFQELCGLAAGAGVTYGEVRM